MAERNYDKNPIVIEVTTRIFIYEEYPGITEVIDRNNDIVNKLYDLQERALNYGTDMFEHVNNTGLGEVTFERIR